MAVPHHGMALAWLFFMRLYVQSLVWILGTVVAGCAPTTSRLRLEPHDANSVWEQGRAVMAKEAEGVAVRVAFDHQDAKRLAFRVEITNRRAESFEVGPGFLLHSLRDTDFESAPEAPASEPS